jgi:gliding motility-associated-like protein
MIKRLYFLALLFFCGAFSATAQTGQSFNYVKGAGATRLDLAINVFHPCDGNDNGYINITVSHASGSSALLIFITGPGGSDNNKIIAQGDTFTFTPTTDLPSGEYDFIIRDVNNTHTINTFVEAAYPSLVLQDLLPITITDNAVDLSNDNCDATPDASISVDIDEGSLDVTGGGNLTFNFSGPTGLIQTGSVIGAGPATRTFSGLRGGVYVLELVDEFSVCTATKNWTVTDPVPDPYTVSSPDPIICEGEDFELTIDDTDTPNGGIDVVYQAFDGATTVGSPVIGDGNPHTIMISGLTDGPHSIYVVATEGTCDPVQSSNTLNVTVNPVSAAPSVTFTPDTYCVGEVINAPSITSPTGGSTYTWYSDATLTTTLTTGTNPTAASLNFSSAASNVTDAWVTETTAAGCEGPPLQITLTVNAPPTAPTVTFTPSAYCVGNTITPPTISTPVIGSTYTWYSDAGLTAILPTVSGTTPTNAELGFSSAAVNATTVYVTETAATSCEGAATTVTLTVNATPAAPAVAFTPNSVCQGDAITPPVITTPVVGSAYTWYSDALLTTPIAVVSDIAPTNAELGFDSSAPVVSTVYVTETTTLSCEGLPTAVTLTVRPTPVAPVVTFSPATYCVTDVISPPTIATPVGGSTYNWYSDAGLTTVLPVAVGTAPTAAELGFSTAVANTATVYVAETNSVSCEGPASMVTLIVNPRPVAPTVTFTPNVYCEGDAITPPVVDSPTPGSTYKWYADPTLLTLLPTTNGVTPTNIELGFDASLANTTTVYVTETTASNCEGAATAVMLTVNPTPVAPPVTFDADYCIGDLITPPSITTPVPGSTYTWYSDAGLTTILATTTTPTALELAFDSALPNTTTVYVTETNSLSCEGAAATVTLNVNARPVAPGVTFTPSTYCQGAPISAPFITSPVVGSTYTWYSDAALTAPLITSTNPLITDIGFSSAAANVTTVYVAETNSFSCQGLATAVTLTVDATPIGPMVAFSPSTYCQNDAIVPPSIVGPVGGSTYKWYSDAMLTTLVATTTTPTNAQLGFDSSTPNSTDIFVTETNASTCEGPATQITLVVNARPGAPSVTFTGSPFCESDVFTAPTISAPVATSTYNWYSDVALTTIIATGPTPTDVELGFTTTVANTATVYVAETTIDGCRGPATTVTMVVNPRPAAPDVTFDVGPYCAGEALNAPFITTPAGGSAYRWYSDAMLTTVLTTSTTPTNGVLNFSTASGNVTTVYVTEVNSFSCESAPAVVTLVVNDIPELVPGQATTICMGTSIGYEVDISPAPAGTVLNWPDPSAGADTNEGVNVVYTPGSPTLTDILTSPGTVTYQITPSANGCTGSMQTVDVTVDVAATAFAGNPVTICTGTVHQLSDAVIGGAGTQGEWTIMPPVGDGLLSSTAFEFDPSLVTFSANTAGDYLLRLRSDVTSPACSAAESFVTITVTDIPAIATPQTKTICGNDAVALEILSSNPGGFPPGTAFRWLDPDGAGPLQAQSNIPFGSAGTIHINDVLVNDGLTNIDVTYSVTPFVGLCEGTQQDIVITVRPSPVIELNQAKTICSGDFVAYEILLLPTNQPAGVTFSWPDPDFGGPATSGLDVAADPQGTIHINDRLFNGTGVDVPLQYRIIARGSNGCTGLVRNVDITINPGAVVEAGNPQTICSNGVATLTGSGVGGFSSQGTWSIKDGPVGGDGIITGGTATSTPAAATFQATVPGDYTLELLTSLPSSGSCPAVEDIVVITVKNPGDPSCTGGGSGNCNPADITATFTATDASCNNNDGFIVLSNITGGTGPYTFELNGSIVNLPANNTFAGLTANSYHFVITDANLCSRIFSPVVISFPGFVNHTTPTVVAPDCTGTGANGSVSLQISDPGSFQFAHTTDLVTEPTTYNPVGGSDIFINGLNNGIYAVWIKPIGAGIQCATKISPIIVSGIYPVTFAAVADDVLCFGEPSSITVNAVTGAPGLPYSFLLTNTATNTSVLGTVSATQATGAFTIPVFAPGPYSLLLSQSQSSINPACAAAINSQSVALTINGPDALLEVEEVTSALSFPDRASGSALVVINASGYDPYETRLELIDPTFDGQFYVSDWSVVELNPQNLKLERSYTNLYAGEYRLELRDASGCVKTQVVTIGVDTQLQIPNVFTPNGDGVNEVFYIRNLPTAAQIVITNRWGKEVFKSTDYQNDWTGGNTADGIYYYRLLLGSEAYSGWVEIVRGGE